MGNGMDKSIISQCTRERARVINENIVASLHKTTNLNGKIDLSSVCVCAQSQNWLVRFLYVAVSIFVSFNNDE